MTEAMYEDFAKVGVERPTTSRAPPVRAADAR